MAADEKTAYIPEYCCHRVTTGLLTLLVHRGQCEAEGKSYSYQNKAKCPLLCFYQEKSGGT